MAISPFVLRQEDNPTKSFLRLLCALLLLALLPICPSLAEDVYTQDMVERSLTAVGNTERFHRAIDKARSGEDVSIVYLGGSITEGASAQPQATKCYAYLSAQLFAEKFMVSKSQLKYRNAGISGTPSLLGVTRCKQDVLAYKPDIVFVEFAVNDGSDAQSRLFYESLVRKLVESETQPAVILIFTLTNEGYSAQTHMQQIGQHFDLGMISVRDAIQPQIDLGKMKWSDYSADFAHPSTRGHAFIAELIGHYFDVAAQTPAEPYIIPEGKKYGAPLANLVNVKPGDAAILSVGAFPHGAVSCYSYRSGWRHLASEGGADPMVLELTSSHMTIAYKQEPNARMGRIEVRVDGKLRTVLNGYSPSAWGNIQTEMIFLGAKKAHTVELTIYEEDQGKNFYILDIGYAP